MQGLATGLESLPTSRTISAVIILALPQTILALVGPVVMTETYSTTNTMELVTDLSAILVCGETAFSILHARLLLGWLSTLSSFATSFNALVVLVVRRTCSGLRLSQLTT